MKFRKKPVVIEAIQFPYTGELTKEVGDFIGRDWDVGDIFCFLPIKTIGGELVDAEPGDWIIRGIKGELYPCKSDIFEATYEPVEET